ncbi:MAG: galactosyldiacylglycerol synthase, partial [Anaerolineae bacterium]|nr:galactosyldiacylglycerol synthase [Anaerolineae bacterium]
PFDHMPEIYPPWVRWARATWGWTYRFTNHRRRGAVSMALLYWLWRGGARRLVAEHPADVYVSVHALFSRPIMRALQQTQYDRARFVTVITDLVTKHAFWDERDVERCLVPTQAAYDRGRHFGLRPDQLRLTGMPVHPHFLNGQLDPAAARQKLALHPTLPIVLLAGGGEGMGPVYRIARELNRRRLSMQLVVIAGRNESLRQRLQAVRWRQPTVVYPFVNNMPDLLTAADILVTKAGPTTVCEACVAGVPLVLSGAVPGQEDGNVTLVVDHSAGAYAPGAARVADTVADWLAEGASGLARRADNARQLGRPDAVWQIADEIHEQAHLTPVRTRLGVRRGVAGVSSV